MINKNAAMGDKFIIILEIIYAIILACGAGRIVEIFEEGLGAVALETWFSIVISILVLIRFFFAPSKNIKILGKTATKARWAIMPIDCSVLIIHSFIIYYMCLIIENYEIFYQWFFILLMVNSAWLSSIWARLCKSKEDISYIKTWCINNFIFFSVFCLITYVFKLNLWVILFVLAFLNSIYDILKTYPYYFAD